ARFAPHSSLRPSPRSCLFFYSSRAHLDLHSFPTRRSSDLLFMKLVEIHFQRSMQSWPKRRLKPTFVIHADRICPRLQSRWLAVRSEEHTSELQSRFDLVCRLLLEKKKQKD